MMLRDLAVKMNSLEYFYLEKLKISDFDAWLKLKAPSLAFLIVCQTCFMTRTYKLQNKVLSMPTLYTETNFTVEE